MENKKVKMNSKEKSRKKVKMNSKEKSSKNMDNKTMGEKNIDEMIGDWFRCDSEDLVGTLSAGDILEFAEFGFSHFGIYIGDDWVGGAKGSGNLVHLAKGGFFTGHGEIKHEWLSSLGGYSVRKNNSLDRFLSPKTSEEIIRDALSYVGKEGVYSLIQNNCEHFASYCRYGSAVSKQIEQYKTAIIEASKELSPSAGLYIGILATFLSSPTTQNMDPVKPVEISTMTGLKKIYAAVVRLDPDQLGLEASDVAQDLQLDVSYVRTAFNQLKKLGRMRVLVPRKGAGRKGGSKATLWTYVAMK